MARVLGRLGRAQRSSERADYLELVTSSKDPGVVADVSGRVNWYLGDRRVPIFMEGARDVAFRPDDAPHLDPSLVHDPGWESERPPGDPELLLYDITPRTALRLLRGPRNATLCSPRFNSTTDGGWFDVQQRYGSVPALSPRDSMGMLLAKAAPGGTAFVLATGPSAKLVDPASVTAELRITCNSAVRDRDLLTQLQPDIIVFADRVFHFGPSRYAATFRRDLRSALDLTGATLVTTQRWAGPLLAHMPELRDRLAVLPFRTEVDWHWPTLEGPWTRGTGNVLTALMLPISFALADGVVIAGCDGRRPDERYFWKHNPQTQYADELMQSAFATHPAFFADRSYADYYEQHCDDLETLLSRAETDGKAVSALTPSHIPALRQRGAPPPSS